MRRVFAAMCAVALAAPCGARTLVITHPEKSYDERSAAGPRIQALLAAPDFKRKLVLMVYADRSEYTFDPGAPGVAFERVVSTGGQLEEDAGDDDFVVGGGFLSACLQDTVTDLIVHSRAARVRVDMAATYAHLPASHFPDARGGFPRTLGELARVAPEAARVTSLLIAQRVYGALKGRGRGDMVIEARWRGAPQGYIDHTTYAEPRSEAEHERPPRLRAHAARPAAVVLDFD